MILTDNSRKTLSAIRRQFRKDFFQKLNFSFRRNGTLLDVGCGDGFDGEYLIQKYKIKYFGIDIYKDKALNAGKVTFRKASILAIPYPDKFFDYVFVHDVLHHVDEANNRGGKVIRALLELHRVCKKDGYVIIVEGNRYNVLGYLHMVRQLRHNHLTQHDFKKVIKKVFTDDVIVFDSFEAHVYPPRVKFFYKFYEVVMEKFLPGQFHAYNVAVIRKT